MKDFGRWFSDQQPAVPAPVFGTQEGDLCNRDACTGIMRYIRQGDCTCFISPPCSACTEAPLICDTCDAELEDLP